MTPLGMKIAIGIGVGWAFGLAYNSLPWFQNGVQRIGDIFNAGMNWIRGLFR